MNDIEKQIEEVPEVKDEERNDNIKHSLNGNDDKKKRIILYVVIGVLLVLLVILLVYFLVGNNSSNNNIDNDNESGDMSVSTGPQENESNSNIGYVSCDDNTSLLNVRNSIDGSIIDGLSCYKEVTIEEEVGENETCKNWYKVTYKKRGSSYTGYACGTYIKKNNYSEQDKKRMEDSVAKALDYYEGNLSKAYCGKTNGSKTISFPGDMEGEYLKSEFKTINELKEYLLSFLDEDLIKLKLELSDFDNPKYYDNYYEIDGQLYCRGYAQKGREELYTGNYDIEITSATDSKVSANIAYEYLTDKSKCTLESLDKCSNYDYVYKLGKVTIEEKEGVMIVTKMDFPD